MVVVVCIPGVTHQGLEDDRPESVKELVLWCEETVVVDAVMKHECEGAGVVDLHDQMQNTVDP